MHSKTQKSQSGNGVWAQQHTHTRASFPHGNASDEQGEREERNYKIVQKKQEQQQKKYVLNQQQPKRNKRRKGTATKNEEKKMDWKRERL